MTDTSELLGKVKQNLILEHTADDTLLERYIIAAVSYAESYQHLPEGYYGKNAMPATTEQAVIMLSSHFYESRDGSTGGFFADNTNAAALPFGGYRRRLARIEWLFCVSHTRWTDNSLPCLQSRLQSGADF